MAAVVIVVTVRLPYLWRSDALTKVALPRWTPSILPARAVPAAVPSLWILVIALFVDEATHHAGDLWISVAWIFVAIWITDGVVVATIVLFAKPKRLIPPALRGQSGVVNRRRVGRQTQ